jgi:sRNA-binding protein
MIYSHFTGILLDKIAGWRYFFGIGKSSKAKVDLNAAVALVLGHKSARFNKSQAGRGAREVKKGTL